MFSSLRSTFFPLGAIFVDVCCTVQKLRGNGVCAGSWSVVSAIALESLGPRRRMSPSSCAPSTVCPRKISESSPTPPNHNMPRITVITVFQEQLRDGTENIESTWQYLHQISQSSNLGMGFMILS